MSSLGGAGGFRVVAAKNKVENRASRGSIPGSIPWPEPRPLRWPGGQGTRWSGEWWRAQFGSPARIREWAAAELTTGRLLPWFAVAYGAGVVLYFTAEREPALWAAIVPIAVFGLAVVLLRRRLVPQRFVLSVIALGFFAIALGFAVATLKTSLINHPVLRFPASGVTVAGFVELREESQHTDRFVLRVDRIEGGRIDEMPRRVRLSVKRGMAPAPGSFVEVKASLDPPLRPLEPGSYDFARDLFFQGIGASGFVRGAVPSIQSPHNSATTLRESARKPREATKSVLLGARVSRRPQKRHRRQAAYASFDLQSSQTIFRTALGRTGKPSGRLHHRKRSANATAQDY